MSVLDHFWSAYVLIELAKALICRKPHAPFPLDHIGLTHNPRQQRSMDRSSWATNWRVCSGDVRLIANYDPWVSPYCADDNIFGSFPALLEYWSRRVKSGDTTKLELIGVVFVVVSKLGRNPNKDGDDEYWGKVVKSWTEEFSWQRESNQREAFARVVMTDPLLDRRTHLTKDGRN
jgi:hypothetical protein